MKFEINKKDLEKYLSILVLSASNKNKNTVLQNVLIETQENSTIYLYTTTLMQSIEVKLTSEHGVNIVESGSVTVNCKKLLEILKTIKDKTIEKVTITTQDSTILIECGKAVYKLLTIPAEQLPRVESVGYEFSYNTNARAFIERLKIVEFSISDNPNKPEYTGAHFTFNTDSFEINSADYQKISITSYNTERALTDNELFTVNVRKQMVSTIIKIDRILQDKKMAGVYRSKLHIAKKHIKVELNTNINVYSGLIEQYIKTITKLFKDEYPTTLIVNKADLIAGLKNIIPMTNEITMGCIFDINADKVSLKGLQNDNGDGGRAELPTIKLTGEPITIAFNAKTILSVVKSVKTDLVELCIQNFKMPVLVKPVDNTEDYKYEFLLVPIIVDNYL